MNKAWLCEKIAELMKHKVIEGLRYVRDESDRRGMRIAMGVKKDHMAGVVVNQLYKHTNLQTSFGIIFLAVVNNRPEILNIKEIFTHFILHRKEIIIRRTRYELNKAEARAHVLEGLKIALDHLDEVVTLMSVPVSYSLERRMACRYVKIDGVGTVDGIRDQIFAGLG